MAESAADFLTMAVADTDFFAASAAKVGAAKAHTNRQVSAQNKCAIDLVVLISSPRVCGDPGILGGELEWFTV